MVIVLGSATGTPDSIDALIEHSLEHVRRSRTEPGCIAHAVHRDVEDPLRLVFVEQWADRASLHAHFEVPESGAFVAAISALTAEPPTIQIHDVTGPTS